MKRTRRTERSNCVVDFLRILYRNVMTWLSMKKNRTFSDSSLLCILTGMVNQNMDPRSSSDVTPITPPINLTNWRDMERPRPVPPKRRVEEFWWMSVNEVGMECYIHLLVEKGQKVDRHRWQKDQSQYHYPTLFSFEKLLLSGGLTCCISNLRWTSPGDELGMSPTEQTTLTDPAAVNLTAFPMRFMRTEPTASY